MTEALEKKLTTNIEFRNRKFKTIDEESENIYLNEKEIERIYSFDLSSNTRLDKVRDMFIIGCYTGLRYSDLVLINDNNLIDKNTKLKIKTEKTGERVVIPLHRYIRSILKKYSGIPDYNISNQKMNAYLKEIADLCNIQKKLTYHIARHTFATTVTLSNGVPIETVSKMLGHRNLKTTQHYAKILDEKISTDMKLLRSKYSARH